MEIFIGDINTKKLAQNSTTNSYPNSLNKMTMYKMNCFTRVTNQLKALYIIIKLLKMYLVQCLYRNLIYITYNTLHFTLIL